MADRSSWTPGMHLYFLYYKACGYGDDSSEQSAETLRNVSDSNTWVKLAKLLQTEGIGGKPIAQGGSNNALFGQPIDRSKPNCDRIHMLVHAVAQDTGKHDHKPGAYNPPAAKMWAIRNRDGTYRTPAGFSTRDVREAQAFYSQAEAFPVKKDNQQIVEI